MSETTKFNQWTENDPDGFKKFLNLAAMLLESHSILTDNDAIVGIDGDDLAISIPFQNWVSEWTRANPTMTAAQALELVKEQIDNMAYDMRSIGQLTFTQTFTVPGGSVTIGGTIACGVNSREQIRAGYAYLRTQALNGYNDFLRDAKSRGATADSLQNQKESKGAPLSNSANGSETEEMQFDKISKSVNKKGQTEIRIYGGKFSKFGVALYPELIASYSGHKERFEELDFGEHAYSGTFTVWMKNGQAVRVNSYKFAKK